MDEISEEDFGLERDKLEQAVPPSAVRDLLVPNAGAGNTNTGDETGQVVAPFVGSHDSTVKATAGSDRKESLGGAGDGSDEQAFLEESQSSAVEAGSGSVEQVPLLGADKEEAKAGAGSVEKAPMAGADKEEAKAGAGSVEQAPVAGADKEEAKAGAGSVEQAPLAGTDKEEAEVRPGSTTRHRPTSRPLSVDAPEFRMRESSVDPLVTSSPDYVGSNLGAGMLDPSKQYWSGHPSSQFHSNLGTGMLEPWNEYLSGHPSSQFQQGYYPVPSPGYSQGPIPQSYLNQPFHPSLSHQIPMRSPTPSPPTSSPQSMYSSGSGSGSGSGSTRRLGGGRGRRGAWRPNSLRRMAFPSLGSSGLGSLADTPDTSASRSRSIPGGFAAAVTRDKSVKDEKETWEPKLLNFLQGDDCRSYREQVPKLGVRLSVNFRDLMMNDMVLGLKLVESQGTNSFWLDPAVKTFFEENKLPSGITGSIDFKGMPKSLKSAEKVFGSKPCSEERSLCGGHKVIHDGTKHGKRCMDTVITGVLRYLEIGISWGGKLKLKHMFIEEDEEGNMDLFISLKPEDKPAKNGRLLDLSGIWTELEKFYILPDGSLPLYFSQLKHDLSNAKHLEQWFILYLYYHPALYSSLPRRNFLVAFQKLCKIHGLPESISLSSVLKRGAVPGRRWYLDAEKSPVLRAIFWFKSAAEIELEKQMWKLEKEKAKVEGRVPVKSDPIAKGMKRYSNSTESLAAFNRNGLEHLDQKFPVQRLDEIELFLAHSFPDLLLDIIKALLQWSNMNPDFEEVWNVYREAKYV